MRIQKKKFSKQELLHGKAIWDASYESGISITYLREQIRELLRRAAEVVTTNYDAQENAINELEEFLR
jgi:hypothetical protein